MSVKHRICLYACLAKDEPLAIAVYDLPEKKFNVKGGGSFPDGGTIFPIAVGVRLTERIRINQATGIVNWTPRSDLGGEPFPFPGGFCAEDPKSKLWVHWTPDEMMRQSLHFMLTECAKHNLCRFRIDLKQDWSKIGWTAESKEVEPKPIKLTNLKWLTAWRLPFWEKNHVPNPERFEQIQELAAAYGIKGWTSFTNFTNGQSTINRA